MTTYLAGKTVLVTAAGQGIGRTSALAFAAAGARVYATDINEQALAALEGTANITPGKLDVLDTAGVAVTAVGAVGSVFRRTVLVDTFQPE